MLPDEDGESCFVFIEGADQPEVFAFDLSQGGSAGLQLDEHRSVLVVFVSEPLSRMMIRSGLLERAETGRPIPPGRIHIKQIGHPWQPIEWGDAPAQFVAYRFQAEDCLEVGCYTKDGICVEDCTIEAPTRPDLPDLSLLERCAPGWSGPDEASICTPYPETLHCASTELLIPGASSCQSLGPDCPSGRFGSDLPQGSVYIDADRTGAGDGSRNNPYRTIEEALKNQPGSRRLALAKTAHRMTGLIQPGVTITGACVDGTQLELETLTSSITFQHLALSGADLTLGAADSVTIKEASIRLDRLRVLGQLSGERVVWVGPTTLELAPRASLNLLGATLTNVQLQISGDAILEDAAIHGPVDLVVDSGTLDLQGVSIKDSRITVQDADVTVEKVFLAAVTTVSGDATLRGSHLYLSGAGLSTRDRTEIEVDALVATNVEGAALTLGGGGRINQAHISKSFRGLVVEDAGFVNLVNILSVENLLDGIRLEDASARVVHAHLVDNGGAGIATRYSTLTGSHLTIENNGCGLRGFTGSDLDIQKVYLEGHSGTSIDLSTMVRFEAVDLEVRKTEESAEKGGWGVLLEHLSRIDIERFLIEESADAGIVNANGSLWLSEGVIRSSPVGIRTTVPPDALIEVRFEDTLQPIEEGPIVPDPP